jgi:hypothetical protein
MSIQNPTFYDKYKDPRIYRKKSCSSMTPRDHVVPTTFVVIIHFSNIILFAANLHG